MLGQVLGSPVQEKRGLLEQSLVQGHKDDEEIGASDIQEEVRGAGTVQLGEEEAHGELVNVYKYPIEK